MRKPAFCTSENKDADQLRATTKLISAFVFDTQLVQFLYFINQKFQASDHLLWLYSPDYVSLVGKPEDRFSHNETQSKIGVYRGIRTLFLLSLLKT